MPVSFRFYLAKSALPKAAAFRTLEKRFIVHVNQLALFVVCRTTKASFLFRFLLGFCFHASHCRKLRDFRQPLLRLINRPQNIRREKHENQRDVYQDLHGFSFVGHQDFARASSPFRCPPSRRSQISAYSENPRITAQISEQRIIMAFSTVAFF